MAAPGEGHHSTALAVEPAGWELSPLGEDDLKTLIDALHPIAEKCITFGKQINVKMNDIEEIQRQCTDPNECLLKVLSIRLKQIPPLTLNDVDTALRSDDVGEVRLANRIREQYCHDISIGIPEKATRKKKLSDSDTKFISDSEENVNKGAYPKTNEAFTDNLSSPSPPGEQSEVMVQHSDYGGKLMRQKREGQQIKLLTQKRDSDVILKVRKTSKTADSDSSSFKHFRQPKRKKHRKASDSHTKGQTKSQSRRERSETYRKRVETESSSSSSETESSSSELSMTNLTESETKTIKNVFKCFFGSLCHDITNPVETAAQLRAKNLLSVSTMKDIVVSSESNQVKAINLVCALEKRIKSRPARIFSITEVFLHNKVVQLTAREMLRQIGNDNPIYFSFN